MMVLYTTYHVDVYYITYHIVVIPEELDYDIMDTDLLLHRCRDRDKENGSDPR